MKLYGIYDKKSELICNIITAPTDGAACRNAEMLCKEGSPYALYSEDYVLMSLADIDQKSGDIIPDNRQISEFVAFSKAV